MSPGNLGEVPSRQQGNQIQILEAKKVWSVYEKKKKSQYCWNSVDPARWESMDGSSDVITLSSLDWIPSEMGNHLMGFEQTNKVVWFTFKDTESSYIHIIWGIVFEYKSLNKTSFWRKLKKPNSIYLSLLPVLKDLEI